MSKHFIVGSQEEIDQIPRELIEIGDTVTCTSSDGERIIARAEKLVGSGGIMWVETTDSARVHGREDA